MKKKVEESVVEMTELVLPNDTNLLGNLLGGRLMHWIDVAGAMAASRHSNRIVATASIDSVDFKHPIGMGELVKLRAVLTWCGKTSMEVLVEVHSENIKTGLSMMTNRAYLTFVALDDTSKPCQVPSLELITENEQMEYEEAKKRKELRIMRKSSNWN